MWRRFATFALQKAKYLCPYKSRKVLSQALQFQTLTAQSPVGYVKHRLEGDGVKLNHHRALDSCLSMIFSENRYPLFRIALDRDGFRGDDAI